MPTLIDFSDTEEAARWRPINDEIMGGQSDSALHAESGHGVFAGEMTLTNGGGFASARRSPEPFRLGGHAGLCVEARGDGRRYQLRVYTPQLTDGGAYRALFKPQGDEWQRIVLLWSDFEAIFRGRLIQDAPILEPNDIQQIGLLIADRTEGPFRLEISRVSTLDAERS